MWVHKVKLGRETVYFLSGSSGIGLDHYRARWGIKVYLRDTKHLQPNICLHTLAARLAVFASSIIATAVLRLLQISKGNWNSPIVNQGFRLLEFLDPLSQPRSKGTRAKTPSNPQP